MRAAGQLGSQGAGPPGPRRGGLATSDRRQVDWQHRGAPPTCKGPSTPQPAGRSRLVAHPPSTFTTEPVTYSASSLDRNTATPPTSDGVPIRPTGMRGPTAAASSSLSNPALHAQEQRAQNGEHRRKPARHTAAALTVLSLGYAAHRRCPIVSMAPGWIVFTVMPSGPSSVASTFANCFTAALLAMSERTRGRQVTAGAAGQLGSWAVGQSEQVLQDPAFGMAQTKAAGGDGDCKSQAAEPGRPISLITEPITMIRPPPPCFS